MCQTLQTQPRAWKRALRAAHAEMKLAQRLRRGGFALGLLRVLSDLREGTRERFRKLVTYALPAPR
jgi:hypothetical protein